MIMANRVLLATGRAKLLGAGLGALVKLAIR